VLAHGLPEMVSIFDLLSPMCLVSRERYAFFFALGPVPVTDQCFSRPLCFSLFLLSSTGLDARFWAASVSHLLSSQSSLQAIFFGPPRRLPIG